MESFFSNVAGTEFCKEYLGVATYCQRTHACKHLHVNMSLIIYLHKHTFRKLSEDVLNINIFCLATFR